MKSLAAMSVQGNAENNDRTVSPSNKRRRRWPQHDVSATFNRPHEPPSRAPFFQGIEYTSGPHSSRQAGRNAEVCKTFQVRLHDGCDRTEAALVMFGDEQPAFTGKCDSFERFLVINRARFVGGIEVVALDGRRRLRAGIVRKPYCDRIQPDPTQRFDILFEGDAFRAVLIERDLKFDPCRAFKSLCLRVEGQLVNNDRGEFFVRNRRGVPTNSLVMEEQAVGGVEMAVDFNIAGRRRRSVDASPTVEKLLYARILEDGVWDRKLLATEFQYIIEAELTCDLEFSAEITGFETAEIDSCLGGVVDSSDADPADHIPDPPKKQVSKLGDLWLLGDHKVICGDALNPGVYQKLMAGASVQLVCSDVRSCVPVPADNRPNQLPSLKSQNHQGSLLGGRELRSRYYTTATAFKP